MQLPNIPPDMIREKVLFSATPPAVAAAVVFGLGSLLAWLLVGVWRRKDWRKAIPVVAVLAFAAGLVVVPVINSRIQSDKTQAREAGNPERAQLLSDTYKFEETYPLVPDGRWWHWGLYAVGLALLVELVARVPGVPVAVGHLFRGAAAGVIASAVLPPEWQRGADKWVLPLTAGVTAAQWALLDTLSRKNPGGTLGACLGVVAAGTACVVLHDGSARFTDFTTFVVSSLAVLAVGGWVLRADVGGGVGVVPIFTVLLLVRDEAQPTSADDATAHVPVVAYWLVALAPLLLSVFLIPPLTRFGTKWYATPVKLLLVLIPVGIAMCLCLSEAPLKLETESWE